MESNTTTQDPSAKTTTLKFTATSMMSPSAKIVVYFVRDDGEIIADSVTIKVNGAFENDVSSMGSLRPGQQKKLNGSLKELTGRSED